MDLKIEFHESGNEVGKFNWFIFRTVSEGRYLLLWRLHVLEISCGFKFNTLYGQVRPLYNVYLTTCLKNNLTHNMCLSKAIISL